MRTRQRKKPLAEINVVPYIDVMLVLLVIFMITAPLLTQGVKIQLPKTQAQTLAPQKQRPIIVSVNAKGEYFLNIAEHPEQVISRTDLVTRIAAEIQLATAAGEVPNVLVKGDDQVNYGAVVQAMVLLQHAGVENVGLMTDPLPTSRA